MDHLTRIRHQQVRHVLNNVFLTPYARTVDLYAPATDPDGQNILVEEEDFVDEDATGALNEQEATFEFLPPVETRIVPCKITDDGKFELVRDGAASEFQADRSFRCLIKEDNVPLQSIIQFEVPTELNGDGKQTMTLIKVDQQPVGQLPVAGVIHIFAWFQGDLE